MGQMQVIFVDSWRPRSGGTRHILWIKLISHKVEGLGYSVMDFTVNFLMAIAILATLKNFD